ncbi:MAG: hypothetical protein WDM80_10160 [Limisphaerales bacterium]
MMPWTMDILPDKQQKAESTRQKSEVNMVCRKNIFWLPARFVEKKNLFRLIQAYGRYRELAKKRADPAKRGRKPGN